MGIRTRTAGIALGVVALMVGGVSPAPGDTPGTTGTIACEVTAPGNPVVTLMDTPVAGNVTCTHSVPVTPVTYSLVPFVTDATGPFNGKLAFDPATGNFLYTPGFYPPDPTRGGAQDKLPEFFGPDQFVVQASSTDGATAQFTVDISVLAGPAVSGVLTDGAGGPLSDAWVTATGPTGRGVSSQVGADGQYSIETMAGLTSFSFRATSARGSFYVDLAPREILADTTVDADPGLVPVSVELIDPDGQPASGQATTTCSTSDPAGDPIRFVQNTSTATGTSPLTLWAPPTPADQTCQIRITPDGAPPVSRDLRIHPTDPNTISVALPRRFTLSGTISDGVGGTLVPLSEGAPLATVAIFDAITHLNVETVTVGSDGGFSFSLFPGTYQFEVSGTSTHSGEILSGDTYRAGTDATAFYIGTTPAEYSTDTHITLAPQLRPVTVHVVDGNGDPVAARAGSECFKYPDQGGIHYQGATSAADGVGDLTLYVPQNADEQDACPLFVHPLFGTPREMPIIQTTIQVGPGTPAYYEIVVDGAEEPGPGVALSGTLSDGAGGVLSEASVTVTDAQTVQSAAHPVGADGGFAVEVQPGSYSMMFHATSARGSFYVDLAPREILADTTVDADPGLVPVTVELIDPDGQPASGQATTTCSTSDPAGDPIRFVQNTSTATGTSPLTLWAPPTPADQTCQIRITPDDAPPVSQDLRIHPTDPNTISVTLPRRFTLSGTISDGVGGTLVPEVDGQQAGQVWIYNGMTGEYLENRAVGADGGFSFSLFPGTYQFRFQGLTTHSPDVAYDLLFNAGTVPAEYSTDAHVQLAPVLRRTYFHVVDLNGDPVKARVWSECGSAPEASRGIGDQSITNDRTAVGEITSWLPEGRTAADVCGVTVSPISESGEELPGLHRPVGIGPGASEHHTIVVSGDTLTWVEGQIPETSDPAGVSPIVESLVPSLNGDGTVGDGNGDGEPDAQQPNVASLPALGATTVDAQTQYLTVEAPAGTVLNSVTTIDPTDPNQVSEPVPDGVSLPLGLASFTLEGVDTGQTETITIYTPSASEAMGYAKYINGDWFFMPADRVRIFANYIEVDLTDGGLGDADGVANGVIVDPGAVVTEVLPPKIAIGPANGATYTVGNVPTPSCTAIDAFKNPVPCSGEVSGATPSGVGSLTYQAHSVDTAGNSSTASVTYQVEYRFDGFLQPINDRRVNPSLPTSSFKAGSTIPVKLQLKRSDGSLVDPSTPPVWISPDDGAASSLPVNEVMAPVESTSGSVFEYADGKWQYNWKTKGLRAGVTYTIGAELDDGTTQTVYIVLR